MNPTLTHVMAMLDIYNTIKIELIKLITTKEARGETALYERALLIPILQVLQQVNSDIKYLALRKTPVKKIIPPAENNESDYPDFDDGKYSIRLSDPSLAMFCIDMFNDPEDIKEKNERFNAFISELKHLNQTSP